MAEYFVNSHEEDTANLFLDVMERLEDQKRLETTHEQSFEMEGLKDKDKDKNQFRCKYDFGRTMSTTMRAAMLHCCDVPQNIWKKHFSVENWVIPERFPKLVDSNLFQLANKEQPARSYWSRMDCLYPHYFIEDNLPAEPKKGEKPKTNTVKASLYIIRDNFREFIEIQCWLNMTRPYDRVYDVSFGIKVKRRVLNDDQPDEDIFDKFKRRLRGENLRNIKYVTEDEEEKVQDDDDDDDNEAGDGKDDDDDGDRLAAQFRDLSTK